MASNRRTLDFRSFRELSDDLSLLETRGYERSGKWSLGQIADHMHKAIAASLDGFDMKPPLLFRLMAPFAKKYVLTKRKMPGGIPAPGIFKPADNDDAAGLAALRQTIARFEAHAGPLHPSPVMGDLSRDEWTQLHLIHASHHLSFLRPK